MNNAEFVATMTDDEVAITAGELADWLEEEADGRPAFAHVAAQLRLGMARGDMSFCRELLARAPER